MLRTARAAQREMAKILIVGNHPEMMLNFRGDLIRHLQRRGHTVVTASPPGFEEVDRRFASWGVRRVDIPMDRTGVSVTADLRLLKHLRRVLAAERPDVVLAYAIKPVIYGALAARMVGDIGTVAMITGLGVAFSPAMSFRQWLVRTCARTLYRLAMRCTDAVLFQNPDDEADFHRYRLLHARQRIERTPGSGVNLSRYEQAPLPDGPTRFVMISRLLADKGVREYIAAAARVREARPDVRFHLVGPFDSNPMSLTPAEVDAAQSAGSIVYDGFTRDVRPHLRACHVYVLPSYREGTPRSVLEALSTGRPIITTDTPGCRETVVDGVNGYLVPTKSIEPLAAAVLRMVDQPRDALLAMGEASRQMAREKFDVEAVNAQVAAVVEATAQRREGRCDDRSA